MNLVMSAVEVCGGRPSSSGDLVGGVLQTVLSHVTAESVQTLQSAESADSCRVSRQCREKGAESHKFRTQ